MRCNGPPTTIGPRTALLLYYYYRVFARVEDNRRLFSGCSVHLSLTVLRSDVGGPAFNVTNSTPTPPLLRTPPST